MLVFRDGTQQLRTADLLAGLRSALIKAAQGDGEAVLDALLRAGELECGLADAGVNAAAFAAMTDSVAAALLDPARRQHLAPGAAQIGELESPRYIRVSPPEGFGYYALHPLDYAAMAARLLGDGSPLAVVGIRSIGTTLSAVVVAAARQRGVRAERVTVRPTGNPWDRQLLLTSAERAWAARWRSMNARFVIVDEGPGMSGSSFLAVAEALQYAGVASTDITLLCSYEPDAASLRAPHGEQRWRQFASVWPHSYVARPRQPGIALGGGAWRGVLLGGREWPATWPHMERVKFLTRDGSAILKFEGLGRFGAAVAQRAHLAARARFAPAATPARDGFVAYSRAGVPLTSAEFDVVLSERIADYCTWRAREFATGHTADLELLEQMLRANVEEELGIELPEGIAPEPRGATIVDGRMLPHEFVHHAARILKTDNAGHGDDHFFPGPTDIAWDLAGCIVEWQLVPDAAARLLLTYARRSGDDPTERLPFFIAAYAAFRVGYCRMAASALRGEDEETRLISAAHFYRKALRRAIAQLGVPASAAA